MITLEIETQFGTIYGTYSGGPYIELSFGQAARPVEVINVFDYEKSEPKIENTASAVKEAIEEWLSYQDDYNLEQYFQR